MFDHNALIANSSSLFSNFNQLIAMKENDHMIYVKENKANDVIDKDAKYEKNFLERFGDFIESIFETIKYYL
jgi:hypothetical protein